ncbi:hypothetical protein RQP46_010852 [Phenoliferia psychrophenolica]
MQDIFATDAALLASVLAVCLAYLAVSFRDGRAIGTVARPDLYTVAGVPLLGNLFHLLKHGDRHMEMFADFRKSNRQEGKILSVTIPGRRLIDITKPSWIAHVQKTNFSNYEKGKHFYENMHDVLGEGAQPTAPFIFSTNNFRGFITTSIVSEIATLKTIIGRYADSGEGTANFDSLGPMADKIPHAEFDLANLFFRFTLESFALMAFGSNIGALSLDSDAPVLFASAFDYAQGVMNKRFTNPLWKITERLTGDTAKMAAASKVMDDFAFGIISQREKDGLGNVTRADKLDSTDLLSLYMALRDENGKPLSRRALRDSVMNLIIAGRDTTAQGLAWTFFHLLTRPELLEPLRSEADQVGAVDYDNFKSLVETQAVFHEKNAWQAIADDHLPNGGPMIKKGDGVHWCDWEMGRDVSVWGPDAATFKPSRWIDEKHELKKESQWKAHFFNGGARLCLGQTLALYEATAVMAAIIGEFDLKLAPGYLDAVEMVRGEPTPRYANSLTLPMIRFV